MTTAAPGAQITGTGAVEPQAFRSWMSRFPTGVAIVTTTDSAGVPRGLTCSSLTSVALEPPTLSVCLRTSALTWRAIEQRGRFAVNLLHGQGRHAAEVFSSAVADRFAEVSWRWSDSGLPRLAAEAFAYAECSVTGALPVGDHTVVLGAVTHLVDQEGSPLLYGHRSFGTWLPDPVAAPI